MAWTHYRDLVVWQKAMDLVDAVYDLTRRLPKEELFALSDQMRRAAVSVPSNIAEGHGRQTDKEFRQFLSIAKGSVFEIETQIMICIRQRYLTEDQAAAALSLCGEVGKILTRLIAPAAKN
jgi:four helix bundle protein